MMDSLMAKWVVIKNFVTFVGGATGAFMLATHVMTEEVRRHKPWQRTVLVGWIGGSFAVMFSNELLSYLDLASDDINSRFMVGGILGGASLPFIMLLSNLVKKWSKKDLLDIVDTIRKGHDK